MSFNFVVTFDSVIRKVKLLLERLILHIINVYEEDVTFYVNINVLYY